MDLSKHKAVVAGLALSLTLGGVAAPKIAMASTQAEDSADSAASAGDTSGGTSDGTGAGDAATSDGTADASEALPAPAAEAKAEDTLYEEEDEGFAASLFSLFSARSSSLTPVTLSDEMKYFCKFESSQNYDQGFSYGDGYNAMGYYQFDRRYSLVDFIEEVYSYNPTKYSMFKEVLKYKSDLSSSSVSMYNSSTKKLTKVGQLADDAWHAAYKKDPEEFSALQDAYAYSEYYQTVERTLRSKYGVDISDRADCVKGLAWGMCNLFGSGGVQSFFDWAVKDSGMSDKMTDRELVNALCDSVVDHIKEYAPKQSQYWTGWINRYENERKICLGYISEDEKQAAATQKPTETTKPTTPSETTKPSEPMKPTTPSTSTGGSTSGGSDTSSKDDASDSKDDAVDKDDASTGGSDTGNGSGSGSDSDSKGDVGSSSGGGSAADGEDGPGSSNGGSTSTGSSNGGSSNGGSDSGAGSASGSGSSTGTGNGGTAGSDSKGDATGDSDAKDDSADEDAPTTENAAIDAKNPGCKVSYTAGDAFDPTGLTLTFTTADGDEVTATYSDDTKDQFSFSPDPATVMSKPGTHKITVTYTPATSTYARRAAETYTASFTITVAAKSGEVPAEEPVAKHTVTFTVKGDTFKTVEVEDGKTVSGPRDVPSFEGYTFAGWYLDGEPFDMSTPVTGDIELVAYYWKDAADAEDEAEEENTSGTKDAKPTATPDGLPQTGDVSSIAMMGAAGVAMLGASATALGYQRRKKNGASASEDKTEQE